MFYSYALTELCQLQISMETHSRPIFYSDWSFCSLYFKQIRSMIRLCKDLIFYSSLHLSIKLLMFIVLDT